MVRHMSLKKSQQRRPHGSLGPAFKNRALNEVTRAYLALASYNAVQAVGWLYILVYLLVHIFDTSWPALGKLVIALQALVCIDVLHAACGLVRPPIRLLARIVGMLQRLWCKVGHRSEVFLSIALAARDEARW